MEQIDSRLHAAWLSQLAREHREICSQFGISLRPPILTISLSKTQLGSWSAADRCLRLSHFLISTHPWSVTLQVLKHEMAHQVCSEIHGRDDAGHGPLFREACTRLGLDTPFQRASGDLAEGVAAVAHGSAATRHGRQVIDKVRKLLALGGSDNEHEAALAVERASELLARHRLDLAALAEEEGLVHRTIDTRGQTLPAYRKSICALLETCFRVRVICASLYDPHANVCHKTIELLGREAEVAIAEHCYHFLENRLQVLWAQNRRGFISGSRMARKSYFLGVLAGFRETMTRSRQAQPPAPPAGQPDAGLPAIQDEQRLDIFVAARFPRLRRMRGRSLNLDRHAYQQAVNDGRNITLHQPVSQGENLRLLE